MADGRAAYDPERLPWLTEERKPRRKSGSSAALLWALLGGVVVAALSYWLGVQSVSRPYEFPDFVRNSPPAATVTLPEPVERPAPAPAPPPVEVRPPPMAEVAPAAEPPPVKLPQAQAVRAEPVRVRAETKPKVKLRTTARKATVRAAPAKKRTAPPRRKAALQAWPAAVSAGAHGRVVRIGAFSSRRQAKKGWWAIVRHYPGMKRLNAVVAPVPSARTGQTLYRLQFGTTSQAHSEVLCQRMRIIGQSCVVVGLPPRGTGARR